MMIKIIFKSAELESNTNTYIYIHVEIFKYIARSLVSVCLPSQCERLSIYRVNQGILEYIITRAKYHINNYLTFLLVNHLLSFSVFKGSAREYHCGV